MNLSSFKLLFSKEFVSVTPVIAVVFILLKLICLGRSYFETLVSFVAETLFVILFCLYFNSLPPFSVEFCKILFYIRFGLSLLKYVALDAFFYVLLAFLLLRLPECDILDRRSPIMNLKPHAIV
jgi:hypothetical protein